MCDHIAYRVDPGGLYHYAVCVYCGEVIDSWPATPVKPEPWWELAAGMLAALVALVAFVALLMMVAPS